MDLSINGLDSTSLYMLNHEGNSITKIDYAYYHNTLNVGINYYRVKQLDSNGNYEYISLIWTVFKNDTSLIYPNLVYDRLFLNYSIKGKITIFNHLANRIKEIVL